ncbi:MAG: 50S ribosomal protein L21 [Candidatus Daviesbacteria bacterium]|nr:50S ribosomal protein L21 [Candidatus Daviesbacteria bacterium]
MLDYVICEISGKQYKVVPNQALIVDFLGEDLKKIDVNVLLLSEAGKISLGVPYLKEKLSLDVVENTRGEKIRVSKFHAKANFRKTIGHKAKLTKVILSVKK